ncbi:kelch-like protein 10 [Plodia interpunctella]|uniref:kelch-like protein 10 n=1 Tax=Plodia interpunctella TaxID=58824 RepID=UPI002367FBE4|nr:kelch-like protein 10 [Plodia interpunctella]
MEFNTKHRKLSKNKNSVRTPAATKQRLTKKKTVARKRKCVCLPENYSVVEFPSIWNELRQNGQLCDGKIVCRDMKSIRVHRAILSAVSPYFKAIFVNSLKKGEPEETEIFVDVPSCYMSLILDYAYTGTCVVTAANVEYLLPYADQFDIVGVIQLCCQFLLQELRPHNCLGIFKFARYYFCGELEKKGKLYIRQNFSRILKECNEFKSISYDELEDILRDDELNVRNEEIVFQAVKTWVEHDLENRRKYIPSLLSCVRYGHISYKYFKSKILQWQPVIDDEKCQEALYPAVVFLTVLDSRPGTEADLNDPLARPRIPYEILFAVGGWSAGSPTSFVETYDTRADRWFLSIHMDLTPRAYHGLCSLNNLIYMIGGFDGSDHFNTVRCYDPVANTWHERACMYQARCYVSVVAHDGLIYALGGYNGRTRMSSVERYYPDKNQWEMTTSMNKQRSDASAASLGGKIYIVGGFNGQEVLSSAEVFDPDTKQWSFIHSMISPRSGVSLIAYRDCLYALGGFNGYSRLNTGEKFNPQRGGDWQEVTEMFSARSNFATVLLDDMIFVIGGFNGSTTIPHVECYDGDTLEWYDAAPMNLNRSALSACVLVGLPNARSFSYLAKAVPAAGADQAHHS